MRRRAELKELWRRQRQAKSAFSQCQEFIPTKRRRTSRIIFRDCYLAAQSALAGSGLFLFEALTLLPPLYYYFFILPSVMRRRGRRWKRRAASLTIESSRCNIIKNYLKKKTSRKEKWGNKKQLKTTTGRWRARLGAIEWVDEDIKYKKMNRQLAGWGIYSRSLWL